MPRPLRRLGAFWADRPALWAPGEIIRCVLFFPPVEAQCPAAEHLAEASLTEMPPCAASLDGAASDGGACCWICLDDGVAPLITPCACPHPVHPRCLARWQLQQAGRPEESACRFCGGGYPDWRAVLLGGSPSAGASVGAAPAPAARLGPLSVLGSGPEAAAGAHDDGAAPVTMAISAAGSVHHLQMLAGPFGKALFRAQVGALLGYGPDDEFEVVFECRLPLTGNKVLLPGFGAYDAARACAAASAGGRREQLRLQGSPPPPAAAPLQRRIRLPFEEVRPCCCYTCPTCCGAGPLAPASPATARPAMAVAVGGSPVQGATPAAAPPPVPSACPPRSAPHAVPSRGSTWRRLMCMAAA